MSIGARRGLALRSPYRETALSQFRHHGRRQFEINAVEAFGEPGLDRRQHRASLVTLAARSEKASETRGGSQRPCAAPLRLCERQSLAKQRDRHGFVLTFAQQYLALRPQQLGSAPPGKPG